MPRRPRWLPRWWALALVLATTSGITLFAIIRFWEG